MPNNFFDTSALGKHYHAEVGTPKVEATLSEAGARPFLGCLGAVEILSVFAGKVRTGFPCRRNPSYNSSSDSMFRRLAEQEHDGLWITGCP